MLPFLATADRTSKLGGDRLEAALPHAAPSSKQQVWRDIVAAGDVGP